MSDSGKCLSDCPHGFIKGQCCRCENEALRRQIIVKEHLLTAATSEVERLKGENERLNRDLSKAKEEMSNSQLHNAFE